MEQEEFTKKVKRAIRNNFDVSLEEARSFYSIQAQSASLFPKLSYEERLSKVRTLFSNLGETTFLHKWGFVVGSP